ncbi:MAG: hypothetical protein K0S09_2376 [Sphingobacteriaceae bacterium]|jgi:uncharacterized membrane protein|nr:hypothetical protein [Sphingobacteriaceae bacterium]
MKLFGHPLHLIFIHFPSALLPMDWVCYFLAYQFGGESFRQASFYALIGGAAIGWLAILTGAIDLAKISSTKRAAINQGLLHAGLNGSVLVVYSIIAFADFQKYPHLPDASLGILITKAILLTVMISGNFIGGNLILKHKVGIEE